MKRRELWQIVLEKREAEMRHKEQRVACVECHATLSMYAQHDLCQRCRNRKWMKERRNRLKEINATTKERSQTQEG